MFQVPHDDRHHESGPCKGRGSEERSQRKGAAVRGVHVVAKTGGKREPQLCDFLLPRRFQRV